MKRILLILLSIVAFSQCNYEEKNIVNYSGYYDAEKKQIKMEGQLKNGSETGEWHYYDEHGNLVQLGSYKQGMLYGEWIYDFPSLQDTVLWTERGYLSKFSFSLPEAFAEMKNKRDTNSYSVFDSVGVELFSLKELELKDASEAGVFFDKNYKEFLADFEVGSARSLLIKDAESEFYKDEYRLTHKLSGKQMSLQMIYKYHESKLIVFTYTSDPAKEEKARFILGEIFYHCWINGDRLADPFAEIKEVVNR